MMSRLVLWQVFWRALASVTSPVYQEYTPSVNPERSVDECLAATAQSLSWPLFQSAFGFSLMCSTVKRGTHWVSVMRHQSEEQPRETKFFHLPLGANKARDELTADSVKALGVEIAIHSFIIVQQKAGFPLSVFSVVLAPYLQKGRLQKLCSPPSYPEAPLTGRLSRKAVICVRLDSSIKRYVQGPEASFSVTCTQTLTKWHPFLIIWLWHA